MTWFRTLLVIATFLTGARAAGIRVPPHVVPGVGVNIVAHQDDDLFFMNPDILNAVVRGQTQVTVFLTAGNVRADDIYFMHGRESGAMDAYAKLVQISRGIYLNGRCDPACLQANPGHIRWRVGIEAYGHYSVEYAQCLNAPIHLLFLRLDASRTPDGHPIERDIQGNLAPNHANLSQLWNQKALLIHSTDGFRMYTRSQLIDLLTRILKRWQPSVVRSQDSANPHPVDFPNAYQDPAGGAYDHSDHYYSGLFARAALRGYVKSRPNVPKPQNWIYNGYNISDGHLTPLAEPIPTYKKWMYYYYALDDYRAWPNGSPMSFTDLYPDGSQRGDWTYYQQATRLPVQSTTG